MWSSSIPTATLCNARGSSRDLGQDIDAVPVVLHHLGYDPHLPLDAAEPAHKILGEHRVAAPR